MGALNWSKVFAVVEHSYVLPLHPYPPPGCGTGNYLAALSEHVNKMTGVEQNEGMLKQSKEKTAHLANVEIVKGNILSLPFPDQQFDGVICNQVTNTILYHLVSQCIHAFCTVGWH